MTLRLLPLLPLLLSAPDAPAPRPALQRGEAVEFTLERSSELAFELDLAGRSIEGFELSSESKRSKVLSREDEDGDPVLLVRYDQAQELVRGPDGEHEIELDLEGLEARVERGSGGFVARSQGGGGLERELEELVLREELAPDGEGYALDWLLADLRALELEGDAPAEIDASFLLWLVGDAEGLFDEGEGTLSALGREELEGEPALVLALEGRVEGTTEDHVEFRLDLEGKLWLEPSTRRPLRIEVSGPLRASGDREGPAGVALEGDGRFALALSFAWQR